ncbi:MAG: FtsX-like permease family protein [Candidatus Faecimonas sp.]|nr:ABC transporter permease [Mycoplasmatota bacterium]MDY2908037.1 FtsX-like permease family protein [Candidatus Faecimonas sp.]
MKKLLKETIVCMVKTSKRFISILVIVLLGVGFFAGIRAVAPDMKNTLDDYYEKTNMYDIYIASNYGIREDIIDKLQKKYDIEAVYNFDAITTKKEDYATKIISYDKNNQINTPKLVKGKMPEAIDEVVIDNHYRNEIKMGDKLTIDSELIKNNTVTVTGYVESPLYISAERDSTNLLSGTIDYYLYMNDDNIISPVKTAAYIKLNTDESRFSKKYEEIVKTAKKDIKKTLKEEKQTDEKWYVLDIDSNAGFYQYEQDTQRIDNVAKVFPLVFFIVAVLICLTTMTRMVEEERSQIGTLKALGYSDISIMFKYILYAALATIIGSMIGVAIGYRILPDLCFEMYKNMYRLGNIKLSYYSSLTFQGMMIALLCTLGATIYTCRKTLKESPANLLRPVAPPPGKRVLLERIKLVWNHLSFSYKVTVRNVFRYKKRFLMTIIGIAGCTGLILAGFGLKDCIVKMVPHQYEDIFSYQAKINLNEEKTNETIDKIKENKQIKDILEVHEESITIDNKDTNQSVTLVIPKDNPKEFIKLQDRKTEEQYNLTDGLIITEKLAKLLEVEENDILKFSGTDTYKEKVAHITENYLFHYIYLPKSSYKQDEYNTVLIKTKNMTEKEEKELANELKEIPGVSSITFTSSTRHVFDDTMDSFAYVSLILIVSAGALAFVVLYNLSSVNISERRRELATIKVLGFYDKEVYQYINRENTILTLIGILLGLGTGNILTMYIIKTCEIDMLMFDTTIAWPSYLYAILITMSFAILVNIILYFSLKKIDMIESLKSIE